MADNYLPGVIGPNEFDRYAKQWLETAGDAEALRQNFLATDGKGLLRSVKFSVQHVVQLVSLTGAGCIAEVPAADTTEEDFSSLVDGNRALAKPKAEHAAQVPHDLVKTWLGNRAVAGHATPTMFATACSATDGPLRGYNFDLADFMVPLFNARPFDQQKFRLNFGLHDYYGPNAVSEGALTQTFGLALRVYDPTSADAMGSDSPFFDMGQPAPPYQ